MGIDEEDLLIRPFRDVVAVGTTAVKSAAALGADRASDADRMSRAAQALVREGERALSKIRPVWDDRVQRYGDDFKAMMGQQASIEKRRLHLEELLWDFDDVTHPDEFDAARYAALQAATKALALDIVETAKRLKPTALAAPEIPRGGFPPLPLLPVNRPDSRSSRPRGMSKALTPPASPDGVEDIATPRVAPFSDFGSIPSRSPSISLTRTSLTSKSSSFTSTSALLGTPDTFYSTTSNHKTTASYDVAAALALPPPALNDGGDTYNDDDDISPTTITSRKVSMSPMMNENRKSSRVNPRLADCNIDASSTYHKLKGLCKGAVKFRKDGHWGSIKLTTEYGDGAGGGPGDMMRASDAIVPLQYEVTKVAGCGECGYAHDLDAIELDKSGSAEAIMTSESGARYRLRLLFKCHLGKGTSGGSADDYYACLWCVSAGVTVREGDATVFRSADDLMQHLSRHPQPLPPIPGVSVSYGPIAAILPSQEFDLHLPDDAIPVPIPDNVTRLATATAIKDHHRRLGRGKLEKPPRYDGEMLEFMEGAQIVGILFPEKWEGKWCFGRHDGGFGAFPAKVIELRPPQESEIPKGGESGMSVTAKWKWTPPKSPPGAPWISLGKGETVTNVQCLYSDYWCWYGTNSKGKTGVFPQTHLDLQTLKAQAATGSSRRPSRGLHLFGR
ncbi:hypothetical protein QBC35DRAFT_418480 [Podospora australis]|uniref:SH3 domain-containing protein n=1 Tax=Podospora australis TaxID=1536484 RepID=A0AAN6WKL3_9PEZI|nr:hypothetical protein QBC35DRAFT_418480 [Podospora australis]